MGVMSVAYVHKMAARIRSLSVWEKCVAVCINIYVPPKYHENEKKFSFRLIKVDRKVKFLGIRKKAPRVANQLHLNHIEGFFNASAMWCYEGA